MSRRFAKTDWTFSRALRGVLVLAVGAELMVFLAENLLGSDGKIQWLPALGFGLALLGLFSLLILRTGFVFSFFRSVRVGIVAILGVGLGSMLGVLIHQEDPSFPIPALEEGRSVHETGRYRHYLDFRHAQAHFTWNFSHGWGYHFLPGTPNDCLVDPEANEAQMAILRGNLDEVGKRWSKDFARGLSSQSATGLLVRQENAEIDLLETHWDDFWWNSFRLADSLDLIRVYRADWFGVLFFSIFFGVLSNTFRGGWRRLLRPRKWGFVVTHAGVLILLSGSWLGRLTEVRGAVQLHVGEASAQFTQFDLSPSFFYGTEDPFAIRLDSFRADYHDVLQLSWAERNAEGRWQAEFDLRPPKHRLWEGMELEFDSGALKIEVLELVHQADTSPVLRAARPDERGFGIARVHLLDENNRVLQDRFLFHDYASPLTDSETGLRLLMQAFPEEGAAQLWASTPVEEFSGWVRHLVGAGQAKAEPIPASLDHQFSVRTSARDYQVRIVRTVPTLRLRRSEDGSFSHLEEPGDTPWSTAENPAVLLRIDSGQGEPEMRWVAEQEQILPPSRFSDLSFEFAWDAWSAPSRQRFALALLADGRVLLGESGSPDPLRELTASQPFSLSKGRSLALVSAFPAAVVERKLRAKEGVGFFDPSPGAVRLRVVTPQKEEEWILSAAGRGDLRDLRYVGPEGQERVALLSFFEDRQELPKEWKSRLSILKSNGEGTWLPQAEGDVRVNDYLHYQGFRFFQRDARPDDPTYSGIGVVYDPGLETVLLGLWMVMVGTMVVFFVTPLITRRHRGI